MRKQTYNKLVRDKMAAVISGNGHIPHTATVHPHLRQNYLVAKLREEVAEYDTDRCAEELADVLAMVRSLADAHHGGWEALLAVEAKKADERGRFNDGVFLQTVDFPGEN